MMLWLVDSTAECVRDPADRPGDWFDHLPPTVPVLREYGPERRRREEHATLGFITDAHPMRAPRRRAPPLPRSAPAPSSTGTWASTSWPPACSPPPSRSTPLKDEPMEFATFDDGHGLIETVLFPDVYRDRGHVLFDQGPFIFRGKVEEEFGAVTVTITQLDRLERVSRRIGASR